MWTLFATAPAAAQDTAQVSDTTRVIPVAELRVEVTRLGIGGIPAGRAPFRSEVLQGPTVRRLSRLTVADALADLPGVSLADQFGSPLQPDVRFRGFSLSPVVGLPQSLSVFVDGVRVNEPDASQVHFHLIPMEEIERVEVIRGPVGPFGKNTLAGALNVVTRRGSGPPSGEVELRGGYFDELEGRGRVSGQEGPIHYYGAGGYFRSGGWRDKNFAEQMQGFAKVGWSRGDTDVWLSYTFSNDSIEGPGSLPESWLEGGPYPPGVDTGQDPRTLQFTGDIGDFLISKLHFLNANLTRPLNERWSLQANAFGRFADFDQFNDNITEAHSLGLTDIASFGGIVQLAYRPEERLSATFGVEYSRNDVDIHILELPNAAFPNDSGTTELVGTEEDNVGVYGELWYAVNPKTSVNASLRYDYVRLPFNDFLDPSQSGTNEWNQVTGTVGADYLLQDGLGVFASYGRGFRAPVILEVTCADPLDPCPLPFELGADPPLDPVKTDTWQAGLRYFANPMFAFELSGYWSEVYDDLFNVIDPTIGTRGFFTNLDKTRRQGVELSVQSSPLPDLRLTGAFSWTRATFQSHAILAAGFVEEEPDTLSGEEPLEPPEVEPGHKFAMVPEVTFNLGAQYGPGPWLVGLNGRFVGPQFMVGDENNLELFGKLESFFVLDGYAEYGVGPATFYLRGQNLLDTEYETFALIAENARAVPGEEEVEPFFSPAFPFRLYGGIRYGIR